MAKRQLSPNKKSTSPNKKSTLSIWWQKFGILVALLTLLLGLLAFILDHYNLLYKFRPQKKRSLTAVQNLNSVIGPPITINGISWCSRDLAVTTYRDDSVIKQATDWKMWQDCYRNHEGCWCYYEFNSNNADKGIIYNYWAVRDTKHGGIYPDGYTLPDNTDIQKLRDKVSAFHLKTKFGWGKRNDGSDGNGDDSLNFHFAPTGYCTSNGYFKGSDSVALWWGASSVDENKDHWYYMQLSKDDTIARWFEQQKDFGYHVRCVRDHAYRENE